MPSLARRLWILGFFLWVMACKAGSPPVQMTDSFSLDYHVNKGLDCAMVQDCGFHIEVAPSGALTRYEEDGSGSPTVSVQKTLSLQQMNELGQLLEETGFFQFADRYPIDDPKMGAGSVAVTHTAWPSGTSKSVLILKSGSLPEEVYAFMDRLGAFFAAAASPAE